MHFRQHNSATNMLSDACHQQQTSALLERISRLQARLNERVNLAGMRSLGLRAEGLEEPGVEGLGVKRRFRAQARLNERVNLAGMEIERERQIY